MSRKQGSVQPMEGARGPNRWFFDAWALVYDVPFVQRATYRPVHDAVLEVLRRQRPRRVLDVGCGTGQLAARIQEALPAVSVVGCDFSAQMLRRAAARRGAMCWARGDAMRLPFRDGSFDTVVSTEAFHWFPDQDAALSEFRRVLVRRGRLLLALVNPASTALSEIVGFGSRLAGEPFYWPTRETLRRRVESAGFRIRDQRRVFRLPGGLLFPPVLTLAERAQ